MASRANAVDRRAAAAAIEAFLRAIGRDEPDLKDSGARVADMFVDDLCSGYGVDTRRLVEEAVIAVGGGAEAGEKGAASLVVVRDLPVVTTCPHHLVPAIGTATVAFRPTGRLLGIGTVAALVDAHARRLRLQEDIGEAVVADLEAGLSPAWVGCRIVLSHACMIVRGERAHGTSVETVAVRGAPDSLTDAHHVLGVGGASR